MALLTCKNLTFSYEGRTVLSGVDFEVNAGDFICIVGPPGAGKSTLLTGLLRHKLSKTGMVTLGEGLKPTEIGYMPQRCEATQDFPAVVWEVVRSGRLSRLGGHFFYTKKDAARALENMRLLGIEDLRFTGFRELSAGQQHRALLARALCAAKRLLLLDEPTACLDPVVSADLFRLIGEVNKARGLAVVIATGDALAAARWADKILHIEGASALFWGTAEDYRTSDLGRSLEGGEDRA